LLVDKRQQGLELVNKSLMIKPAERYYDKVTEEAIPLKLKDWPPRTTFKETLPAHYTDYLRVCDVPAGPDAMGYLLAPCPVWHNAAFDCARANACVRTKYCILAIVGIYFLTVSPPQSLGGDFFL
jgi:hypothetical protein